MKISAISNKMTIHSKLLVMMTACIFLFSMAVMLITGISSRSISLEKEVELLSSSLSHAAGRIDTAVSGGMSVLRGITENSLVQEAVLNGWTEASVDSILSAADEKIRSREDDVIFALFTEEGGVFSSGAIPDGLTPSKKLFNMTQRYGAYAGFDRNYTGEGNTFIPLCIYKKGAGFFVLYIGSDSIAAELTPAAGGIAKVFLLSSDNSIILSSASTQNPSREDIENQLSGYSVGAGGGHYQIDINSVSYSLFLRSAVIPSYWQPLSLAATIPSSRDIIGENPAMSLLSIMSAIVTAVALCFAVVFVSYRVVRPISRFRQTIAKTAKRTDEKHFSVARISNSGDELYELEKAYDDMIDRVLILLQNERESMEKRRALELAALQIQINPHFLYNTLDTIAWIAKLKKQPDIEQLVLSLAKFFRISLHKGDRYIKVSEEIELCLNYINIEKIRFPDKIELECHISDSIKDSLIMKIILQPLVENAIKHGIGRISGKGTVSINGFRDKDDIVFEVTDNGAGFIVPEDFLKKRVVNEGTGGYGLMNVDERIRLEYGEGYGLRVESTPGKGTKAIIRIKSEEPERITESNEVIWD